MKKTKNLIQMLTFLQNDESEPASRFLDYGCYCSPHERLTSVQGHGQPIDDLDRQCFRNMKGRICAKLDWGSNCHGIKGYTYQAVDDGDGNRDLKCVDTSFTDPPTTMADCRRAQCECDVHMVKNIIARKDIYDMNKSKTWGSFSVEDNCERDLCKQTQLGCHDSDMCCGDYPHRQPLWSQNGIMTCCNNKAYNTETHSCCENKHVQLGLTCDAPLGEANSTATETTVLR